MKKGPRTISLLSLTLILLCIQCFLTSCGTHNGDLSSFDKEIYTPEYAAGFSIIGGEDFESTIIKIKNPWQGANDIEKSILIKRNGESVPKGFNGIVLDGDAKRVVCMSSTYVAMLDAIGGVNSVVGVSGSHFVTNEYIRKNIDKVGDVGYDGNINYELLVSLHPDVVLLYGVAGASSMESKLKELNIPFVYIGEYLENDPIGKSEWMVLIGEITGRRVEAIRRFNQIPVNYNSIKNMVKAQPQKPKIMVNTPYEDNWFMPSSKSYVVRLIEDAGGEYVYPHNSSDKSISISSEEALFWADKADIWINIDGVNTLKELKGRFPKFRDIPSVANGMVYKNDLKSFPNGGNDYWESGVVYPDLVLSDMVKAFYPHLMEDISFNYYRVLE